MKIEQNVPMPHNRGSKPSAQTVAIRELAAKGKVGDSIFLGELTPNQRSCVGSVARGVGVGWYSLRRVENGYRLWRVGEPKPKKFNGL
jgi:hypothetical protein